MSDPDEPQSFQEAMWVPDLIAKITRGYLPGVQEDVGHGCVESEKKRPSK